MAIRSRRPTKRPGERRKPNPVFHGMAESATRGQNAGNTRVNYKVPIDLGRRHPQGQVGPPKGVKDRRGTGGRRWVYEFEIETRHTNPIKQLKGIRTELIDPNSPAFKSTARMTTGRKGELKAWNSV